MNNIKKDSMSLVASILLLILGVILISNPGGVVKFITYILGGIIIIIGIAKIISYLKIKKNMNIQNTNDFIIGIISIIIGIVIIFCSSAIEFAIRLSMGGWILYSGITKLIISLKLKEINVNNWYLVLVSSIIMIACGLYIIIKSNLVLSGIGIVLVIYAIIDIVQFIMIPKSKNPDIIIK